MCKELFHEEKKMRQCFLKCWSGRDYEERKMSHESWQEHAFGIFCFSQVPELQLEYFVFIELYRHEEKQGL